MRTLATACLAAYSAAFQLSDFESQNLKSVGSNPFTTITDWYVNPANAKELQSSIDTESD